MFSFLDIWFIKKELNQLMNSRFEKFFQGENFVILQFSKEKKLFLKFVFGKALFLADKEKNKEFFIEKNQKLKQIFDKLERFILKEIKIYPGERVVDFVFEGFGQKKTLRFSVFGKGEIELLEDNLSYLGIGSEIKKNINIENLQKELNQEMTLEKFLNNYLGFGKYYLQEFKERNKEFDYSKLVKELSEEEKSLLIEKILEFLNQPLNPFLAEKRPFPIEMVTQKIIKKYNTFSEALDDFFRPKSKYEKMIEETLKAIEKQKKKIEELEKEKEKYEEIGNLFYNYYAFFEELKNYYEKAKEENKLDAFFKKLEEFGFRVDKKEKCVYIDEDFLKNKLKEIYGY